MSSLNRRIQFTITIALLWWRNRKGKNQLMKKQETILFRKYVDLMIST